VAKNLPSQDPEPFTSGDSVSETETVPTTRGRTGVAIGILIVTLLALAFYFYWRTTGMRDDGGRPAPPREISAAPALLEMAVVG
jgi:hypothetical protein